MDCKEEKHVLTRQQLKDILGSTASLRDRALLSFVYLTGCRRIESTWAKVKDITVDMQSRVIVFLVYTAKKRDSRPPRDLPCDMDIERGFYEPLLSFLKINRLAESHLFPNVSRASEVIKSLTGHGVHCLRHTRNTHLKTLYNFSDSELMRWNGWTDPRMCLRYTHLGVEDLLIKMRRSNA